MAKWGGWQCAGALVFVATAASAAPGTPSASGSGASARPATPGSASARGARDAGPPETKEQRAFRIKYLGDTLKHQHDIVGAHVWTPEMVKASSDHWRRAYRALRIRELAEDDKDTALVGRVDAFLTKIDTHYFALLTDLTSKAPEQPAPPTVMAPADQTEVKIGQPLTFKLTPVKDAWQYTCILYEPGHAWTNWKSSWKWSDTNECTIGADDPHWTKFQAGKATFTSRAVLKAKSTKGVEYRYWSQPATIHLALTGGVSPSPSGGATPRASASTVGGAR
jgi:hypothetical protein